MAAAAKERSDRLGKQNENLKKYLALYPDIPLFAGEDVDEVRRRTTIKSTPASADVVETEVHIPVRDGSKLRSRVYVPAGSSGEGLPVFVLFHFGGFVLANPEAMERECRIFTRRLRSICVMPAYRKGPEFPWPQAPDDAWDTLKWVADHAKELGGDLSKGFVVGGWSPGANIGLVAALTARDEKLSPPLTGIFLSIPFILSHEVVPEKYKHLYLSYEQNANAPILPHSTMEWFLSHYKPDVNSWRFNPFNHPDGHAGLPPVYFMVCGQDPLRDESLIYEQVLREDYGIKTKMDIYPGMPHVFWGIWPDLDESKKATEDAIVGAEWLLEQKK